MGSRLDFYSMSFEFERSIHRENYIYIYISKIVSNFDWKKKESIPVEEALYDFVRGES